MAIIGIVTAVVVPRVGNSLSNLELRSSARSVAACLRYANTRAMTRKMVYLASFDLEKGKLLTAPLASAYSGKDESGDQEGLRSHQPMIYMLPKDLSFYVGETDGQTSESNKFDIYFFENGTCSGGRIFLANKRGKAYKLVVDIITSQVEINAVSRAVAE